MKSTKLRTGAASTSRIPAVAYRTLVDEANVAIAVLTRDGMVLDVNRRWEEIAQLTRDRLVGLHIRDFAPSAFENENVARHEEAVNAGRRRVAAVPIRRADGSTVFIEFSTSPVDVEGQTLVFSVGRDVTENVEARRQLQASEQKYRRLVESLPDVVWSATVDGRPTFISPNIESVCGCTPDEIIDAADTVWFDRVHYEDRDRVRTAFTALVDSGTPLETEFRWQRNDDKWIWLHGRAAIRRDNERGEVIDGLFSDVTARRRLELEMRQAQKMEALGLLTGGIAHDFNNLLGVVLGNGRFLLDALPEGEQPHSDAEEIVAAAQRAAALTKQLLVFGHRQVLHLETLNLNAVVSAVEGMLRRVIGEDIELSTALEAGLGAVCADAGQMEQVLMNLVVNARDAMPHGGKLAIETANTHVSEVAPAQIGAAPGDYVMLAVSDTGTGMDAETQRRIFDPFFTTKAKGKGTGLGLSTCHGIIKQSEGWISVYSELGHGTTFRIYLPKFEQSDRRLAPRKVTGAASLRGTERILVIEDDERLRATVRRILVTRGYEVLEACGGDEAFAISRVDSSPLDLILSDIVIPGCSGPEIVSRVRSQSGDVAVVFMSGYTDHAVLQSCLLQPGTHFIQKPFAPDTLAAKIREVLDAR